jgi:MFS family permease
MTPAEEPPYPSGRYTAYLVSVLLLAWIMSYLDRQIITLLLPSLKVDLGVSDTQVSLIQGMAFASVYAVAGLPMGWIADHTNRRNLLVGGIIFWSLATLACGFADSFWHLFIARMAVGLGEACLGPACISMMADYFRPAQRGRALGVMMTGPSIGAASSLYIGGMLLTSLTHGGAAALVPQGWAPWQIVFIAIATPGLLVAALVATLKEPARRKERGTSEPDAPKLRLVDFLRTHPHTMALFYGLVGCMALLAASVSGWAPTVLMRIYGLTPTQTGAICGTIWLTCSAGAGLCSGFVSDALVRRWQFGGRMLVPLIGLPVEICAQIALLRADSVVVFASAMAVSIFTTALITNTCPPAIQDLFPNQLRGRAFALVGLVNIVVGLGCGTTLVALVTDRVFRDDMMLQKSVGLVGLTASVLALLIAIGLPRLYAQARRRALDPPQPAAPIASVAVATSGNG